MGTHPIFESDFDCLTERECFEVQVNWHDSNPLEALKMLRLV